MLQSGNCGWSQPFDLCHKLLAHWRALVSEEDYSWLCHWWPCRQPGAQNEKECATSTDMYAKMSEHAHIWQITVVRSIQHVYTYSTLSGFSVMDTASVSRC